MKLTHQRIHPDWLIYRWDNGIKLIKPEEADQYPPSATNYFTGHTVKSIQTFPFNFYFLDAMGNTLLMNDPCVEICGFESTQHSIGKSLFDVSTHESAKQLIKNCDDVMATNKIKIFEENNLRKDGISLQFLSVKSPWYGDNNQIIGTFGCSIVMGQQSLSDSLAQIAELGLLSPGGLTVESNVIPSVKKENDFLSERESLCVFHLCKGFTVKETAKMIGISPKTVETYVDRAKQKLNCQNKAELIATFLQQTNLMKGA